MGTDDLQGRSAYHPLPVEQGGQRILYVGHHAGEALNPLTGSVEVNGTSIVDVTDPARPVYLHHIPATGDARGAQMVQVCSGADLPGAGPGETYLLRANGNQSHELWDVSDPADPALVTTVATMGHTPDGVQNTHKNWWECDTGIAYLIGTVDGWRAPRVVQAFDLATPSAPRRIRDFSLDGVQPDASGPVPGGSGVHEVVPVGERLYLSYGTSRNGVLQVVDRERFLRGDPRAAGPLASSPSGLRFPQIRARLNCHDKPCFKESSLRLTRVERRLRMRYRGASFILRGGRAGLTEMRIPLESHRVTQGRPARVCLALVCGLMALLVPAGALAGQDAVANPYEGDPAARRAGAALYGTRCAECHGADAKGISGPDLTALWAVGTRRESSRRSGEACRAASCRRVPHPTTSCGRSSPI